MNPRDKEALRQQMLLRALLGDARPGVVTGWLQPRQVQRGLAVYQANAGALAERALAAAYPTVQQLLGEESFAALARGLWRQQPPAAGDIGLWGEALPGFMAAAESLADEAYLPDMARLEWALHRVQTAADAPAGVASGAALGEVLGAVPGLALLGTHDPAALRLHLPAGSAVLASAWPVFSLWQAHQGSANDRFDGVRAALAEGRGEQGLITRCGWAPRVLALPPAEARFTAALLAGHSLAAALQETALQETALQESAVQESGAEFDFEAWLITALQQQRLVAVSTTHLEELRNQ